VLDPLFEKTGVQLVLGGHAHNYERTTVINGVTYMVDGGGGNGLNVFSGTPPSWSAYRAAEYSYLRLKISSSQILGTEIRQDGTTGDSFTIAGTATVLPDTVIDTAPARPDQSDIGHVLIPLDPDPRHVPVPTGRGDRPGLYHPDDLLRSDGGQS